MNRIRILAALAAALTGTVAVGVSSAAPIGHPLPLPKQTGPVTHTAPPPKSPFKPFSPTLGGTVKSDFLAHAAGGAPVIEGSGFRMSWAINHPGVRDNMDITLHIDNARNAKVVSITTDQSAPRNPNTPANVPTRFVFAVKTGSLTLKHTGPGNLWKGTSYKWNFIRAAGDLTSVPFQSTVNVTACNNGGCAAHTFTLIGS